jgi:hypothetical protein
MPVIVMESPREYVERIARHIEEDEHDVPVELRKVTVRLPENIVALLDYAAGKLRHSRTSLAEELLVRAVEEAVAVVGLPKEEDGFELHLALPIEEN